MAQGRIGFLAVCFLAFIVVGAGLERVRQAVLAPPAVAPLPELERPLGPPGAARPAAGPAEDVALKGAAEALRRRVAELERALAEREAELARRAAGGPPESDAARRPGRDEFRERLERMKKENPEAFAEMEKRREEFRQRFEQREQSRSDFLSEVNTQDMTDAQRENHERLIAALAKVNELRSQRGQAGGGPPDEASREALRESMMELGPLYEQERAYLFEQAARAAGYEGDEAAAFVGYIQEAVQSTTPMPFGPMGGPGGGPPGPP